MWYHEADDRNCKICRMMQDKIRKNEVRLQKK